MGIIRYYGIGLAWRVGEALELIHRATFGFVIWFVLDLYLYSSDLKRVIREINSETYQTLV